MSFILPSIVDANKPLDKGTRFVNEVITPVDNFFSEYLNISWKINTIITTSLPQLIIPEDGVGGRTYASDFVVLAINRENAPKASEMLAHELAHAVRWGKNSEWSKDLFCELVSEGLAVHIEAEFAKTQKDRTFFLKTILAHDDNKNRKILKKLERQLKAKDYNYTDIFFGSDKWARWTGYCIGYYIVKRYLEKTGKTIFDAIGDSYENFWIYVV